MACGPLFCTRCHLPVESRAWGLPFLFRWWPLFGRRSGGTVGRAESEERHRKKLEAGAGVLQRQPEGDPGSGMGQHVATRGQRSPGQGPRLLRKLGQLSQGPVRHLQGALGLCSSAHSLLLFGR